jgi:hypothetical protein
MWQDRLIVNLVGEYSIFQFSARLFLEEKPHMGYWLVQSRSENTLASGILV